MGVYTTFVNTQNLPGGNFFSVVSCWYQTSRKLEKKKVTKSSLRGEKLE
jgi:hypothetical protein